MSGAAAVFSQIAILKSRGRARRIAGGVEEAPGLADALKLGAVTGGQDFGRYGLGEQIQAASFWRGAVDPREFAGSRETKAEEPRRLPPPAPSQGDGVPAAPTLMGAGLMSGGMNWRSMRSFIEIGFSRMPALSAMS